MKIKTRTLITLALVGASILFNWHFIILSNERLSNIHYRAESNLDESQAWIADAIEEDIDDYKKRVLDLHIIAQLMVIFMLGTTVFVKRNNRI